MTNHVEMLKKNDLKATFQRMSILKEIENFGHATIDDIYEKVSQIHASLSLATIYKNIIIMVEKGVLVEVPIVGRKSKYELLKDDHIHLVCTECGKVEDKPCVDAADEALHKLIDTEHFSLEKQQINLYGICGDCKS